MTNRMWTLPYALGLAVIALLGLAALGSPVARADQPVIVYQNLNESDELSEPPYVIQMCFSAPIDIRDQPDGGDWSFNIQTPQGQGSAIRIVFQPNAFGVAMYPVAPPSIPAIPTNEGAIWTFSYKVADKDSGDELEGAVHFTINPDAQAIPRATPPSCTPEGGTGSATQDPNASPAATDTPVPTRTPKTSDSVAPSGSENAQGTGSGSATPTVTGSATPGTTDGGDGGGSDTLAIVAIVVGAIALVGAAGGTAYYVRRRRRA